MLRFVLVAVVAGVLAGTALAADPNNGGGQQGNRECILSTESPDDHADGDHDSSSSYTDSYGACSDCACSDDAGRGVGISGVSRCDSDLCAGVVGHGSGVAVVARLSGGSVAGEQVLSHHDGAVG